VPRSRVREVARAANSKMNTASRSNSAATAAKQSKAKFLELIASNPPPPPPIEEDGHENAKKTGNPFSLVGAQVPAPTTIDITRESPGES